MKKDPMKEGALPKQCTSHVDSKNKLATNGKGGKQ